MARLSEFSKRIHVCFVEYSFRRGLCVVLGEGVTRPSERISPKRDDVLMILF